jgi:hypothetical protein
MKKCFYFPTWIEELDVAVGLDESYILKSLDAPREDLRIYPISTPSDPILVKLCAFAYAKMYGDYVVFGEMAEKMYCGIKGKPSKNGIEFFQEYSKFLRNEDNQWESIKKVMDLGDLIV